jgi:hypothetical protein
MSEGLFKAKVRNYGFRNRRWLEGETVTVGWDEAKERLPLSVFEPEDEIAVAFVTAIHSGTDPVIVVVETNDDDTPSDGTPSDNTSVEVNPIDSEDQEIIEEMHVSGEDDFDSESGQTVIDAAVKRSAGRPKKAV